MVSTVQYVGSLQSTEMIRKLEDGTGTAGEGVGHPGQGLRVWVVGLQVTGGILSRNLNLQF
jgi:hypothetical protein